MNRIVVRPHSSERASPGELPSERPTNGADPDVFRVSWRVAPARAGAEKPRLGFSIEAPAPVAKIVRVARSSRGTLGLWLLSYSAVFAVLVFAVPAFQQMFVETGITLPAPTEWMIAWSDFARTGLGGLVGVGLFVGSILAFNRANGRRRELETILVLAILLAWGCIALLVWCAFTPMIQTCQKL